ncbi:MAG: MazG family protein [Frankiales bacterium]|nr:MazG family protein [Frankiales bacterium]
MTGRPVLLATSPRVAPGLLSAQAWALLHGAREVRCTDPGHPLVPVLADVGIPVRVVAADAVDAHGDGVVVLLPPGERPAEGADSVVGSHDLPGAHLLDLVAVMDRLRSPGGCPWDAEQTHLSLVEYLVEEAYETAEAIETGDDDDLREELGDVLLQVAFHARIAEEHERPWDIDDVADGITAKLVSRHPHVFADHDARTPEEVEANWKRLKAAEKGRDSVTDGIPAALPALVLAAKLLRRSRDVADVEPLPQDVTAAAASALDATAGHEGDLLLALVERLSASGVDAEQALREAVRRRRAAVRAAEGLDA